jgi:S-DNA-T family DNA segregation ATPase FtsK/SpoIIIE
VLTRFELEPGPGVKVNRILGLADDLALAMRAKRVRILAPIPGRGVVGIEVPNAEPETVYLKEILDECDGKRIPIALGKRLGGDPFAADVCDMPHLLVAGATGSGKSVCLHSIISSILMTRNPREVRLALVDPKMLELSLYQEIPHLWSPVILQAGKATGLLEKLVEEMEDRYSKLTKEGARTIEEYNNEVKAGSEDERMPYVVVIIDELADLMLVSGSEVEQPIARLAQMARAVGIHLIVATQRPSVDVITGVIKANFPSRIAFNVQSKTDSRTILDMNGAEKLLGKGDMLFLPAASPEPVRVHGSFLSTDEAQRLVAFWRDQPSMPYEYEPPDDDVPGRSAAGELKLDDPLLDDARKLVVQFQQGSVSFLQRRLRVGYSRAARLIDMLEQMGVVGPFQGSKARDVLIDPAPEPAEDDGEDGEDGKDE